MRLSRREAKAFGLHVETRKQAVRKEAVVFGLPAWEVDERSVRLTLPWPPSANHYYRCYQSRAILSEEGREYRAAALAALADWKRPPIDRPCRVCITTFAPDNRRRDIDNRIKSTTDSLQHCGVVENDALFDDVRIIRGPVCPENPRVEVVIEVIDG